MDHTQAAPTDRPDLVTGSDASLGDVDVGCSHRPCVAVARAAHDLHGVGAATQLRRTSMTAPRAVVLGGANTLTVVSVAGRR